MIFALAIGALALQPAPELISADGRWAAYRMPDGRCEVQMTYAAEDWMARQLLGFGADVEVLAPESLAGRVRRAASEALAAYAAMGSGAAG